MTNQFGKELKKLRIDLGITLMDMAQKLGISSAFLSGMETGKKRIPDHILGALEANYPAVAAQRSTFEALINQARQEVSVPLRDASMEDAILATALARRFSSLSQEDKEKIKKLVTMME